VVIEAVASLGQKSFPWSAKNNREALLTRRKLKIVDRAQLCLNRIGVPERDAEFGIQMPGKCLMFQSCGHCLVSFYFDTQVRGGGFHDISQYTPSLFADENPIC